MKNQQKYNQQPSNTRSISPTSTAHYFITPHLVPLQPSKNSAPILPTKQDILCSTGCQTVNMPSALTCPQQKRHTSIITNFYIEQIKKIYKKRQFNNQVIDALMNLFHKADVHYLIDLSTKISLDDYRTLLANLFLVEKEEDGNIIQKGRKSSVQYILLQGQVSYKVKIQGQQQQLMNIGNGYPGFVIYPQIFMSPKYVNYTVSCQKNCTFLALTQQIYNRILKKLVVKEIDHLAGFLSEVPIFVGMGSINIRKYLSYFIMRSFKYNQIINPSRNSYHNDDDDKNDNCTDQLYVIVKGQVQIFTKMKQSVKGNVFPQASATRTSMAVPLNLMLNALNLILNYQCQVAMHLKSSKIKIRLLSKIIQKLHNSLLSRNIKILNNKQQICINKITKRKKKKAKKQKNSLVWWGLAENVKVQHKYKVLRHPQLQSSCNRQSLQPDKPGKNQLLHHKINQLKKRIIEGEAQYDYNQDQQNQQLNSYKINNNYIPKIKTRIKMLQAKPKAIDVTQIIKKKLITYAKNMGSFCDRLNLQ